MRMYQHGHPPGPVEGSDLAAPVAGSGESQSVTAPELPYASSCKISLPWIALKWSVTLNGFWVQVIVPVGSFNGITVLDSDALPPAAAVAVSPAGVWVILKESKICDLWIAMPDLPLLAFRLCGSFAVPRRTFVAPTENKLTPFHLLDPICRNCFWISPNSSSCIFLVLWSINVDSNFAFNSEERERIFPTTVRRRLEIV